jgi:DNA-binding MarR family transcriptional regulator
VARTSSRLQQELMQTRPFSSPLEECFLSVVKTADVLLRMLDRRLQPYDLSHQQYNVLRILRGAGPDGIPTLAIAGRLIESTPGMTRLLDRMEKKGLARRQRCPHDRRQVLCFLTPNGEQLLDRVDPLVKSADQCFEQVTPAEIDSMIDAMERIREQAVRL